MFMHGTHYRELIHFSNFFWNVGHNRYGSVITWIINGARAFEHGSDSAHFQSDG